MKGYRRKWLFRRPVNPIKINADKTASTILEEMCLTAFQGRALGEVVKTWKKMLAEKRIVIWMGLAGAMAPAGMRKIIGFLIKNRMIDVLVTTGANIYHDLYEAFGGKHYQKTCGLKDESLKADRVNRIYDLLVDENKLYKLDSWIEKDFAGKLSDGYQYSSREIIHLLGRCVSSSNKSDGGILASAYQAGMPVFVPALPDSSIGFSLMYANRRGGRNIVLNGLKDVEESVRITEDSSITGVVYIGGGVPKNFIQQTAVIASYQTKHDRSHKYAVQVTMDMPFWGGLSGSTLEEGKSWGKISRSAKTATCYMDASVALPLIAHALAEENVRRRTAPRFHWKDSDLTIEFKALT
ncbi:MAG: deoxyhypusine synthase family protein [Candidatus Bathyarchaeia archaeon]